MNYAPLLFLGVLLTFATSWLGMIAIPQLQIGRQQPVLVAAINTRYPSAKPGQAQQGAQIYRANGCYYCHTQQVRPPGLGGDMERGFGKRFTVAQDYLYEYPVMIGNLRMGQDLANIGVRQPDANWHFLHLYNPQITSKGSVMPPYAYLFTKQRIRQQPSPNALPLTGEFAVETGFEVVPNREASALVAYLQSLQAEVPLYESPIPTPATEGTNTNEAPATATNAPAAGPGNAP